MRDFICPRPLGEAKASAIINNADNSADYGYIR
jgi:hypothetical protein